MIRKSKSQRGMTNTNTNTNTIKIRLFKNILSCNGAGAGAGDEKGIELDLREEYANAFRTESYNDFWTRVLALTHNHDSTASCKCQSKTTTTGTATGTGTAAARLPSYRLFAEHLLDPDQPMVTQILALNENTLMNDYFAQTANASFVCGSLLKDVDRIRAKYRSLKTTNLTLTRLTHFSNSSNPFLITSHSHSHSHSSPHTLQAVQLGCFQLLKQLEFKRDKVQAKLALVNKLKLGSAVSLVTLTVTLTVIIVTHAVAALVAAPAIIVALVDMVTSSKLAKLSSQLDVAAKGTFILSRDLDTISRLVDRLSDEMEHMRTTAKFWLKRITDKDDQKAQAVAQVAQHLNKNDSSFSQRLDELEEHLYLCFMTINRARNLVVKEIIGQSTPPNLNSSPA